MSPRARISCRRPGSRPASRIPIGATTSPRCRRCWTRYRITSKTNRHRNRRSAAGGIPTRWRRYRRWAKISGSAPTMRFCIRTRLLSCPPGSTPTTSSRAIFYWQRTFTCIVKRSRSRWWMAQAIVSARFRCPRVKRKSTSFSAPPRSFTIRSTFRYRSFPRRAPTADSHFPTSTRAASRIVSVTRR